MTYSRYVLKMERCKLETRTSMFTIVQNDFDSALGLAKL